MKARIVGAFGDGTCSSQRHAPSKFSVSLGTINKVLKENNVLIIERLKYFGTDED